MFVFFKYESMGTYAQVLFGLAILSFLVQVQHMSQML